MSPNTLQTQLEEAERMLYAHTPSAESGRSAMTVGQLATRGGSTPNALRVTSCSPEMPRVRERDKHDNGP